MRRFLSAILALILSTQCALAQGSVQSPNLFWATPLSGTGFLTLRAIGVADLSGTTSNIAADTLLGNPTGSAAPAQPITILSPLVFSGTTLGLSSASTTVNGVVCTLGSTCTIGRCCRRHAHGRNARLQRARLIPDKRRHSYRRCDRRRLHARTGNLDVDGQHADSAWWNRRRDIHLEPAADWQRRWQRRRRAPVSPQGPRRARQGSPAEALRWVSQARIFNF
jgi:hypothetical protein